MTLEEQNKALDAWETSARYWDKYRVLIAQMFAPLTSRARSTTNPKAGCCRCSAEILRERNNEFPRRGINC